MTKKQWKEFCSRYTYLVVAVVCIQIYITQAVEVGSRNAVVMIMNKIGDSDLSSIINNDGDTLLHTAAASSSNKKDAMEFLLSLDPDLLETENREQRTPLHVAAYGNIFSMN